MNPKFPDSIVPWTDKRDTIDDVLANDINQAYAEIIAIETVISNGLGKGGIVTIAPYDSYQKQNAKYVLTGLDDADVINSIIDSLPNGGGIQLLDGTIKLGSPIRPKPGIQIEGSGESTVFLVNPNTDIDAIQNSEHIYNVVLSNFMIDMNKANNVFVNGGTALHLSSADSTTIKRVRTRNAIHSLKMNYDNLIDESTGLLNKVLFCEFEDSEEEGILWGWRITDSWFCFNNVGSAKANVVLRGSVTRFIGNHFNGNPEYNVHIPSGIGIMIFQSNIFENAKKHAIYAKEFPVQHLSIEGNLVVQCGTLGNGYDLIHIEGSPTEKSEGIIIQGNQMYCLDAPEHNVRYPVYLANVDGVSIIGNRFKGYYADTPVVTVAGTVTNIEVMGNCGDNEITNLEIYNLLSGSNDFLTPEFWDRSSLEITVSDTELGPFGEETYNITDMEAYHMLKKSVQVQPDTEYCFSFYAKNIAGSSAKYCVYNNTSDSDIIPPTSYINLINSDEFTRIEVPFTTPSNCSSIGVYLLRDSGAGVDLLLTDSQLNIGLTAMPYQET